MGLKGKCIWCGKVRKVAYIDPEGEFMCQQCMKEVDREEVSTDVQAAGNDPDGVTYLSFQC